MNASDEQRQPAYVGYGNVKWKKKSIYEVRMSENGEKKNVRQQVGSNGSKNSKKKKKISLQLLGVPSSLLFSISKCKLATEMHHINSLAHRPTEFIYSTFHFLWTHTQCSVYIQNQLLMDGFSLWKRAYSQNSTKIAWNRHFFHKNARARTHVGILLPCSQPNHHKMLHYKYLFIEI